MYATTEKKNQTPESPLDLATRVAHTAFGNHLKCVPADMTSGIYNGVIVYNDSNLYLQKISATTLVAHPSNKIQVPLTNGVNCSIKYVNHKPIIQVREAKSKHRTSERDR